jgi:hypothetical protein
LNNQPSHHLYPYISTVRHGESQRQHLENMWTSDGVPKWRVQAMKLHSTEISKYCPCASQYQTLGILRYLNLLCTGPCKWSDYSESQCLQCCHESPCQQNQSFSLTLSLSTYPWWKWHG